MQPASQRVLAALTCTLALPALLSCTASITQISSSPATGATAQPLSGDSADLSSLPPACHYNGALPDATCTPGATDPAVTQANIGSTICVRGYTTRVRPPVSYTDPLKRQLMARYGSSGSATAYELDHLIPLEVGGSPTSVHNLWPQSRDTHPGSPEKDRLENWLRDQVCGGRMTLADAQRSIAADWVRTWQQAGQP